MKNDLLNWALWLNVSSGRIIYRPVEEAEKIEDKKAKILKWTK